MSWLNRLEKKADPIAVPGLLRYVAFLSAALLIVGMVKPELRPYLELQPGLVLKGEFWRVLTFPFIPSSFSVWWIFALWFLMYMSDTLEQGMGATRLTLYYVMGILATVGVSFVFGMPMGAEFINLSLLLAFGTLAPDAPVMLFLILPVKVKWLAIIGVAFAFIQAVSAGFIGIAALAVALGNYLLFFGPSLFKGVKISGEVARRRHEYRKAARPDEDTLHRCNVCNRTEKVDEDLEFRVAADGEEYCLEHLPART